MTQIQSDPELRILRILPNKCSRRACLNHRLRGSRLCPDCIAKALKRRIGKEVKLDTRPTNIYAIVAEGDKKNLELFLYGKIVKFGVASDPKERIKTLQTGSFMKLDLYGFAPCEAFVEKVLHRVLARHKINGEWFRSAPKVLEAMSLVRKKQVKELYEFCGLGSYYKFTESQGHTLKRPSNGVGAAAIGVEGKATLGPKF